jgi:3-oxoadipate enol-lactonase
MHYRVDGLSLGYDDEGSGLPVVLLHGFPFNRTMWRPQVERLSKTMRVITPDFRGHGESDAPDYPYTMDLLARDVARLLDQLGIDEVVLGGLSMGGYVAFSFYHHFRERVRALLLFDTRPEADTEEGRSNRARMADLARREGATAIAEELIPKVLGETTRKTRPEVVAHVRQMIEATPVVGIVNALHGMAQRPDMTGILPSIRCPVLVVVGEEDTLTPPAVAEKMAAAIPNAELAVIPKAGHVSNLEQPELFAQRVEEFLA